MMLNWGSTIRFSGSPENPHPLGTTLSIGGIRASFAIRCTAALVPTRSAMRIQRLGLVRAGK